MAAKSSEVLRPRSRRRKAEVGKCQDCESKLTDANWTPSMQKYKRYICGACWTARQRRYQNVDPARRQKKLQKERETRAGWSDERRAAEARKRYDRWLQRAYGVGIDAYEQMLEAQGGKCAICATDQPTGKGGFHVDHCHGTGAIRSLLCSKCNMMLGMAGDSPAMLRKAAIYIENNSRRADHKPENRAKSNGKKF